MVTDEESCGAGSSNQTYGGGSIGTASPVRREIFHKSSKEFYKAVAAQWGISCKMSDRCRCLECQVNDPFFSRGARAKIIRRRSTLGVNVYTYVYVPGGRVAGFTIVGGEGRLRNRV